MSSVDLHELVDVLECCSFNRLEQPFRGFVHRLSGETLYLQNEELGVAEEAEEGDDFEDLPAWQRDNVLEAQKLVNNWEDYVEIDIPSKEEDYEIMKSFCEQVSAKQQQRLYEALSGRRVFSRFRDEIYQLHLEAQWFAWKNECLCEYARKWCKSNNFSYH